MHTSTYIESKPSCGIYIGWDDNLNITQLFFYRSRVVSHINESSSYGKKIMFHK